jgi:predicted PurR-regulated permease PerM
MHKNVFFVVTTLLAALVLYPLAAPLCVGLILGFLTEGVVERISRRLKKSDPHRKLIVSSIFVLAVTLLFFVPIVFSLVVAASDLTKLVTDPSFLEAFSADRFHFFRDRLFSWTSQTLSDFGITLSIADVGRRLGGTISDVGTYMAAFIATKIAATPWVIFQIILAVASWIFFAANGRDIREKVLPHLIPWERERNIIRETVARVVETLFVASASLAFIQALIVTIILGVTSVPRFLMFGLLSFFVSFIPVVGTGLVLVPAALYLLSEGRWFAAIFVATASIAVGLVDNVLRPFLMREGLPLGFFWLFVAVLGGVSQFGLAGALVGPVAFSLFAAAHRILAESSPSATTSSDSNAESSPP